MSTPTTPLSSKAKRPPLHRSSRMTINPFYKAPSQGAGIGKRAAARVRKQSDLDAAFHPSVPLELFACSIDPHAHLRDETELSTR